MESHQFYHNDYDALLGTSSSEDSPQKMFNWTTFDGFSFPNDRSEIDDNHFDSDSILTITETEEVLRSKADPRNSLLSAGAMCSPLPSLSGGDSGGPLPGNGNISSLRDKKSYQGCSRQLQCDHGPTLYTFTCQRDSCGSGMSPDLSENFRNNCASLKADCYSIIHNPAYYTGDPYPTVDNPALYTEDPLAYYTGTCKTASVDQCDMTYDGHQLGGNFTSTSLPITFPKESVAEIIGSQHPSSYDNYLTSQSSQIVPQYRQDVKNSHSPETELELDNNDASLSMTHPTANAATTSLFLMTPGHSMMTSGDQRAQHQGQHRCIRRRLPEGEEKNRHKRNLANRRNKKYIEKKKMEEQDLEAEKLYELQRKKMLLEKLHSLQSEKTFYEMYFE